MKNYKWMVLPLDWKPPHPSHGGTRVDTELLGKVLAERQRLKLLISQEDSTHDPND